MERVFVHAITRDPKTGELTVIGVGINDSTAPDPNATVVYALTKLPNQPWSEPEQIYLRAAGLPLFLGSVTAYDGQVFVAIDRYDTNGGMEQVVDTMGYIERSAAGVWSSFHRVSDMTSGDLWAIALANSASGHLHATWTRAVGRKLDLMHSSRVGGAWSEPQVVALDQPTRAVRSLDLTDDARAMADLWL
jgi:hypothetical protein